MPRLSGPLLLGLFLAGGTAAAQPAGDYLGLVRAFADTLLMHGTDTYGAERHPFWAGLIHADTYHVPALDEHGATVGADGYYDAPHRRAVGGANLYHDLEALQAFDLLTALTGDATYATAADAYRRGYLEHAQNPDTGLLGWGEHLYYNFHVDSVIVGYDVARGRSPWQRTRYHEFLDRTPSWEALWAADAGRTRRALEGLRYHFRGPTTQTYLFNRHARWDRDPDAGPYGLSRGYQWGAIQPWIKHSALLAYSFATLYARTGEPEWRRWAEGVGTLYWRYRDPVTGLVPSNLDDPRPTSAMASLSGMSMLSYWLYRAGAQHPDLAHLQGKATALFDSVLAHAWDEKQGAYHTGRFLPDGTPEGGERSEPAVHAFAARTAAFFAEQTGEPRYRQAAKRWAALLDRDPLPPDYTAAAIADRILFLLDLHALTGDGAYLEQAEHYAARGTRELSRGGLFTRRAGDVYYESKDGPGRFALALLRLHLVQHPEEVPAAVDWWM